MTSTATQTPQRRGLVQRWNESRIGRYAREARENDLGAHVLAISAQQLLCTAPLAVALAAVGRRVTGVSFADILTHILSLTPQARDEIVAAFAGSPRVSLSALLINLVLAVAFGVSLAATLQRGLELIWHLPRARYVGGLLRQVGWALSLPLMISAVVLLGRGGHLIGHHARAGVATGFALQVIAIALFIWCTQYILLSRRVAFHRLWLPTMLSTLGVATVVIVGRQLISGQVVPAYHAYGSVGIGIVLSAWVAIASSASSAGLALGCWLSGRKRPAPAVSETSKAPEANEVPV
jgi:membrane protein